MASVNPRCCTGFGDCDCEDCFPPDTEFPLATHGALLGFWRTLWLVAKGVRLYG